LAIVGFFAFAACSSAPTRDDVAHPAGSMTSGVDATERGTDTPTSQTPARRDRGTSVNTPKLIGPISGGRRGEPFSAMPEGLASEYGYTEEEYFVQGDARRRLAPVVWPVIRTRTSPGSHIYVII
jgi:hypothetical protein